MNAAAPPRSLSKLSDTVHRSPFRHNGHPGDTLDFGDQGGSSHGWGARTKIGHCPRSGAAEPADILCEANRLI